MLAASMAADSDAFVLGLAEANLALAARCAAALNATDLARPDTIRDLQRRLLARMTDREADLRARIEAGLRLGELGDPRFERHRGPPRRLPAAAAHYRNGRRLHHRRRPGRLSR